MPDQLQIAFERRGRGPSQAQKLADFFRAHPDVWIEMTTLARIITETGIGAAVHSRIADLRKKFGMRIATRVTHQPTRSFYKYVTDAPPDPEPSDNFDI